MATSTTLQKIAQGFSGVFLGLTGSWLLVICIGGLLTLGVLSIFHVGVLLSLGCIGVCLLVAGVCLLSGLSSKDTAKRTNDRLDNQAEGWPFQAHADVEKPAPHEKVSFRQRFNRPRNSLDTEASGKNRSYHLF